MKVSGNNLFSISFMIGFVFYTLGFAIWIIILKYNPLSVAFPIAASSLIITTQIIGYFFLRENFNLPKLFATVLIISGIIIFFIESIKKS